MEEQVFDRLHETAYEGQSLGRTILGPEANIKSITREQLEEYVKTQCVALARACAPRSQWRAVGCCWPRLRRVLCTRAPLHERRIASRVVQVHG